MTTRTKPLLLTHPDCLRHAMARHPERPERLQAVLESLEASGLTGDMQREDATEIDRGDLALIHPEAYIDHITGAEPAGDNVARVDPDTYMSAGSLRAARLAAGACVAATRRVLAGETDRAFCAVRPPGHHAEISDAMGFCLFNNVAAAARVALADPDIERVAILDFDVHHCNGTVDIFKDDDKVLVCSSFQNDFYPNRYLDFENDHVKPTALDAGTSSASFRRAIERDWLPAIDAFRPQLIFVSAGFDAHAEDPLGGLELTDDDYTWITELIVAMANDHSQGRIVSTMEGGYDLAALARAARHHVAALLTSGR